MNVHEIVSERTPLKDIPRENGIVTMNALDLVEALKPIVRWQRSSGFDEPLLNAVMIIPKGKKTVQLVANDMVTRIVTEMSADHVSIEHPVAVDIRSMSSLLALNDENVSIVTDDQSVIMSVFGGWAHLPSYDIVPEKIIEGCIYPKEETEDSKKALANSLITTIGQLKKLASAAPAGEMRLLFGTEDKVYACDGNVVASSSCNFLKTAVSIQDAEVIYAIVGASDPSEKIVLMALDGDRFAITTERFSYEFSKKGVYLSKKVASMADETIKSFFYVDADTVLKVVRAVSAVKDAGDKVTLEIGEGPLGYVLEAMFEDENGNNTRIVLSTKSKGVNKKYKVEVDVDYVKSIMTMCSSESMSKLEVSSKGIAVESDSVYAVIISGNVG